MDKELSTLIIMAATIGFFHTLIGPDHYLPFIMMAASRRWSVLKTTIITILCGLGHVASSIVLGFVGIALGVAVGKLETIESERGNLAAWAFVTFGLVYFVWGVHRAIKNKPHKHLHRHGDEEHEHIHTHTLEHSHVHEHVKVDKKSITPWMLFVIFILGPCEPLIPSLMYPAAKGSMIGVVMVSAVFGVTTIITMVGIVLLSTFGVNLLPLSKIERYMHALAGGTVLLCGLLILLGF